MSRVIEAVLQLTDKFSQPLQNSINMMTSVEKQGDRVRRNIEKVGAGIEATGQKLTTAVTLPLVGLGAASYSTFEGVDKQLSLVQATMGDAAYATADLNKALGDAAVNSIFTMEEGAGALVNFARQGFDAAQSADMLAPSMNLAAGTATDLAAVTSGLGNTLKAFGASSEEAAHYADMFAQAQAQANTDVSGLFDAMSIAGPIAKTVGWSFEDIATLTGVFGDASISASEGANALKTGLARLARPAKQGSEAMKRLGIDVFDTEGNLMAMPQLIGELQKGFAGLSQQDALAAASDIFGKNQMSKWMALINGAGTDSLQAMRDQISGASGNAQAAADALVTPMEKLKSTFDVFKATLGGVLAEVIVPMIDKVTVLVDKFRNLSTEQQQQIVKWAGIAAAVGPALMVFGKLVIFGAKLAGVFGKVKAAGGILKAVLAGMASPVGIVVAAIAGLAAIVAVVITHFDEFKEAASGMFERIQPSLENLGAAFGQLWSVISPVITSIGDAIAGVLISAIEYLGSDDMIAIINGVAGAIGVISDVLAGLISFLTDVFTGDWESAWTTIKDTFAPIAEVIGGALGALRDTVVGIKDALGGAATNAKNFVSQKWDGLKSAAGNFLAGNATGTTNWQGGLTRVNEKGGEIIDLPSGSRIYPHDQSLNMARGAGQTINIPKLADQIVIREDADIDKMMDALVRKMNRARVNMAGAY